MTAPASRASSPLRQLTTLAALIEHINASGLLDGAILVGSFARGAPDAASDLDLIVCVRPVRPGLAAAHRAPGDRRHGVVGSAPDPRPDGHPQVGDR
jgi:hypothetical protein